MKLRPTRIRDNIMTVYINKPRIIILLVMFGFLFSSEISAQSVVYFFVPTTSSNECTLKMNSAEIGELRGPLKKTIKPIAPMKIPYKTYAPCYKKCTVKQEGKVLFAIDYKFTNVSTMTVSEIPAEIQLNLSEGSVHYIKLAPKGLNNNQFKEITEKEAQKLLKKNVALPEYIED